MKSLIILGKVKELYKGDELPSIKDMISGEPVAEKQTILEYLKNGRKGATAAGFATDVITGERIPGEFCCFSDGKYGWRSDTIYYFEKYNLKLNDDFINDVLN